MFDGVVLSVEKLEWELQDLKWGRRSSMEASEQVVDKVELAADLMDRRNHALSARACYRRHPI